MSDSGCCGCKGDSDLGGGGGCCKSEDGGCCVKFDTSKFALTHIDPDLFHRSQWDGPGGPSTGYVVYRTVLALVMMAGVIAHGFSTIDTLGAKWFIYMTNQGILFLTIHYLVYAGIVIGRRLSQYPVPPGSLPFIYSTSWGLQSAFFSLAVWISLIYWTFLHAYVVEYNLMKTDWMKFLNVFLHALNSVSCLIDIFVTARPVRIYHFYLSIIFGVYYAIFSVIYWAAGGTGICRCMVEDMDISICPDIHCDKYIYPILDWEDKPGLAFGMILFGCLFLPLIQTFWWGLYRLRLKIYASVMESRMGAIRVSQNYDPGTLR